MTNDQVVREMIRQLRGIAMNYPTGFQRIADEVRALTVPAPEDVGQSYHVMQTEPLVDTTGWVATAEGFVSRSDTPKEMALAQVQGERRKRGRPKKVKE